MVPEQLIVLLQRLYDQQRASVQAGVRSRGFDIRRGVKQGDPISAILFIAVMQDLLGGLQQRRDSASRKRNVFQFGVPVGGSRNLTDLRFADDIVLVAQCKADIQKWFRISLPHHSATD